MGEGGGIEEAGRGEGPGRGEGAVGGEGQSIEEIQKALEPAEIGGLVVTVDEEDRGAEGETGQGTVDAGGDNEASAGVAAEEGFGGGEARGLGDSGAGEVMGDGRRCEGEDRVEKAPEGVAAADAGAMAGREESAEAGERGAAGQAEIVVDQENLAAIGGGVGVGVEGEGQAAAKIGVDAGRFEEPDGVVVAATDWLVVSEIIEVTSLEKGGGGEGVKVEGDEERLDCGRGAPGLGTVGEPAVEDELGGRAFVGAEILAVEKMVDGREELAGGEALDVVAEVVGLSAVLVGKQGRQGGGRSAGRSPGGARSAGRSPGGVRSGEWGVGSGERD